MPKCLRAITENTRVYGTRIDDGAKPRIDLRYPMYVRERTSVPSVCATYGDDEKFIWAGPRPCGEDGGPENELHQPPE